MGRKEKKAKHKIVKKWVAVDYFDYKSNRILTAEVDVIESDRQFRLMDSPDDGGRSYRLALHATRFRTHVNKAQHTGLYDTERAALMALLAHAERDVQYAENRMRAAKTALLRTRTAVLEKFPDADLTTPDS